MCIVSHKTLTSCKVSVNVSPLKTTSFGLSSSRKCVVFFQTGFFSNVILQAHQIFYTQVVYQKRNERVLVVVYHLVETHQYDHI